MRQPLASNDTTAMLNACQLLGSSITWHHDHLEIIGIDGHIAFVDDVIDAANSGLVLRFLSAILAVSPHYSVITGDYSIRHQRPILPLLAALQELGAFAVATKEDNFAPVIIRGPLKAGTTTIAGADSQPVSALLIAAAFVAGITEIKVTNPGEKAWILLTLKWLDFLGIPYENHDFCRYRVFGRCSYTGFDYTVPGDFSSAAFPMAAALITGSEITLDNLDMQDIQGDKRVIHTLQAMGAEIDIDTHTRTLHVKKGGKLVGMEIDANAFIDAVPILAVIACFAEGQTHITNAAVARQKESDRLHAITAELRKMGAQITELADGLVIEKSPLYGAHMRSHDDHRIAMSLLCAALGAKGESTLEDVECVAKTFPNVAQAFQSLGARITGDVFST